MECYPSRKKLHYNPVEAKIKSFHEKVSENLIFRVISDNRIFSETHGRRKTTAPKNCAAAATKRQRYADKLLDRPLLF